MSFESVVTPGLVVVVFAWAAPDILGGCFGVCLIGEWVGEFVGLLQSVLLRWVCLVV